MPCRLSVAAACFETSLASRAPTGRCGGAGATGVKLSICSRARDLLEAAYCYRIVALDEPPSDVLRVGGEALDALRLVPESGQLTALGVGVLTLGPALERRASALFAERRMSLALALDKLGNEILFALSRRVQDRIVIEARKADLTAAGELRAGDPGLPLAAQSRGASPGRRRHDRRERDAWPGSAPAQVDVDGAGHRHRSAGGQMVALRRLPFGAEAAGCRAAPRLRP